ncbi:hypothetical protein BDW72DRAFT_202315 [Aspergillus terricola var. indicus]
METATTIEEEDFLKRSPSRNDEARMGESPQPKSSQTAENRLRPAADILNRLIWDESYNSTDFVIGYEDRFEGRLEASLNSWKKDSTDEERKMPQRRHRIDFSLLRRRQNFSSASSSDLSPGIPVLQSPMSFHAMASPEVPEATLKRNKLDRAPVKPSMFFEDMDEEDDGPVTKSTAHDHKDVPAPRTAQKVISGESPPKTQFFEDSFNSRVSFVPPVARIGQDSLVVIEVLVNVSRSESFMFVSMQVIPSLRFGNSTVPAYSMKVFALPYLIAPITNLRSTILIQAALHDILHIQPSRGIILYIPVAEENMATNNTTMMGEVARLQSDTHGRGRESGIFKSLSRSLSRRKKSSSGASAPLSVATTSWAAGSDVQEAKATAISESEGTNTSADEGSVRPRHTIMDTDTIPSKITEVEGDLFDAPDGTALIHACNCLGSWGAGIAGVFRKKYSAAYEVYESHCRKYLQKPQYHNINLPDTVAGGSQIPARNIRLPEGSTLIIPPQKRDYEKLGGKKHWIICLFTSRGYGRNVSGVDIILQNTELAIADLKDQLDELKQKWSGPDDVDINELRACRFNSGLFGVDWALTRRILEDSGLGIIVVRPPGEK